MCDKLGHVANACFFLQDLLIKKIFWGSQEVTRFPKPFTIHDSLGCDGNDVDSALLLNLCANHHLTVDSVQVPHSSPYSSKDGVMTTNGHHLAIYYVGKVIWNISDISICCH